MKLNRLISVLAVLFFSQSVFSCVNAEESKPKQVKTKVKATDLITISIGENARTHTKIGSIDSDSLQHDIHIEMGTITHEEIGVDVSSCLELPIGNINCN